MLLVYDEPIRNKLMAVKHEIKSQLAKLLATEDLIVEHRQTETACFNVETRVLTLPLWDKASGTVYDMLVGHEVGHALFTPNLDTPKGIPMQFVNIVEDVRIEKLIKRRFPGLTKSFFKGYGEMHEDDFFELDEQDVDKMNLADRANLYFKIGNHIDIKFNSVQEDTLIRKIADTETWEEVLEVSKELYDYCKQNHDEKLDIDMVIYLEVPDKIVSNPIMLVVLMKWKIRKRLRKSLLLILRRKQIVVAEILNLHLIL